ncbi:MAG: serine/threonine-protein kinase, partial [Phycisphaerales bacterium JB039]
MIHQRDTASRVRDLYEDGHDPAFGLVVDILQPVSEVELAEAIEADGRLRLALGRSVDLDRYLAAEQLEAKPVALDAAIEVALRAASRASAPDQRDVDYLVSRYPKLQRPIREAAMLAQALRSTTSIRRRLTHDHPARRLPADFGPRLADGRARYELLELLGEGASGAVYRAVDRHLSDDGAAATVAIKVFAPGADPALADWMRGEALKARRVSHENVVRALDRGETDEGESYIVYEFVDGGDLGSYVRARGLPLPARQAARLLSQVARGVQAVHAAGLVHCDLKPGNIAMTRDGAPKVADFGIAMREGQQPRAELGAPGAPLGNLAFISPEQFRGDPGAYSFPSDIYALGGMLAYFVTGELPNGATAEAIRTSHRAPRPVDPPARLDRDLRRIIVRATDPDPARRHASASELADDLDRGAQRRPLQWGRTGLGRRARLFARRRPVLTALALLALGGVATAAGVKIREDVRRVDVGDFISEVMEGYVND